jgi:hypothetical protein
MDLDDARQSIIAALVASGAPDARAFLDQFEQEVRQQADRKR